MQPSTDADSAAIFERCRAGDPEAIAAAYDRWGNAIYGTALRILRNPAGAEEVVQESFVTLIEKAPTLRVRNLGGWLHRVAANRSIDRLRRRRPQTAPEDAPALATEPTGGGPGLDLEAAIEQLPSRAREVFLLHDVEGFRHREIAEMLEVSEGTSKSQLFRARQLLRASLSGEMS